MYTVCMLARLHPRQTRCSSFGWTFSVALVARRSRFYAGTRYRKRGLNVDGQVGNDVETEQLLYDESTRQMASGHVMSFVQALISQIYSNMLFLKKDI